MNDSQAFDLIEYYRWDVIFDDDAGVRIRSRDWGSTMLHGKLKEAVVEAVTKQCKWFMEG